MEQEVYILEL